jgi:hypothetical protein
MKRNLFGARVDPLRDPMVQNSRAGINRIVPFVQTVLGLLVSVMVWGWKVAPVAFYEALITDGDKKDALDPTDDGQAAPQSSRRQKTVVVACVLGFYYFLFVKVVEPLVYSSNCCSNYAVTVLVSLTVVMVHFVSGLTMHFHQERTQKEYDAAQGHERGEASSEYRLEREMYLLESEMTQQPEMHDKSSMKWASHGPTSNAAPRPDEIPTKKQRWWPFSNGQKSPTHGPTGGSPIAISPASVLI